MNSLSYNIFKNIFKWLKSPFAEEIQFFLFTFCFSAITDIIGHSILYSIQKGIYIGLHHY